MSFRNFLNPSGDTPMIDELDLEPVRIDPGEWCADPYVPGFDTHRVIRGGSLGLRPALGAAPAR